VYDDRVAQASCSCIPAWQRHVAPYAADMSMLQALQDIKDDQGGALRSVCWCNAFANHR
jgi:hypothetical protein